MPSAYARLAAAPLGPLGTQEFFRLRSAVTGVSNIGGRVLDAFKCTSRGNSTGTPPTLRLPSLRCSFHEL
jgi:hypothetical protein